jgi:hypothetical protein
MAECPYKECIYHSNCEILEIIKKIPKSKEKCSYFAKEVVVKKKNSTKKDAKETTDL